MNDLDFIHRFVAAKENSTRTLLLLHGTGADENDLIDLGHELDPSAALLSPRGKVLENGAPRFFRRLAEGVFDEADVIVRTRELAHFVEEAAARYKIDINNLVAVGYSNGANIAAAMMLLGVAKFSQAILFRAMVPLSHVDQPAFKRTRVLISAGEFDPIAGVSIAKKLAVLLSDIGNEVDLIVQPGVGHELAANDIVAARQWLAATG